jgi:maltodextrin utilization protein YvdJ
MHIFICIHTLLSPIGVFKQRIQITIHQLVPIAKFLIDRGKSINEKTNYE